MSNGVTPDEHEKNPTEIPCPCCGEMVRVGLVRCWNCSAFMREDIAEAYRKMQENPSPMIFSKLPDDSDEGTEADSQLSTATMSSFGGRDDDDFELDENIAVTEYEASDDDFQLTENTKISDSDQSTIPLAREETVAESEQDSDTKQDTDNTNEAESASDAKAKEVNAEPTEDHSVATGGDVLLDVAMQEEKEDRKRRKGKRRRRSGKIEGGVVVYCPNGHRIRVREEYRGAAGKCPACGVLYLVPLATDKEEEKPETDEAETTSSKDGGSELNTGAYKYWFNDVKLHAIDPTKLKLKPNSLEKTFTLVDLAISNEKMLLPVLSKGGLLGGNKDKQQKVRAEIAQHLSEEKDESEIPAQNVQVFDTDQIQKLRVVFPAMYDHESVFAGVPVFGKGRIAILLPKQEDAKENQYLTLSLTEYRKFSKALNELHGISNLGQDSGIPLTDQVSQVTCHYSEESFETLDNESLHFYEADPEIELALAGRQCEACQLIVSEDSRKKERIGGKTGKGIAKAKCPKCNEKFGNISLWQIAISEVPEQAESE
ncbi:hypothetical protein [Gimesia aquarii]|uniref:Uncharacterized protein n=1 Tax=Gimesia aquarii TaxID=2527964 RepID=A0A517WRC8_9PLAN|nr:hypothetical protein [Gimesia aquarii]QDU07814.1 hypothetical protein V202x_11750 [Gimesia aquarii]